MSTPACPARARATRCGRWPVSRTRWTARPNGGRAYGRGEPPRVVAPAGASPLLPGCSSWSASSSRPTLHQDGANSGRSVPAEAAAVEAQVERFPRLPVLALVLARQDAVLGLNAPIHQVGVQLLDADAP